MKAKTVRENISIANVIIINVNEIDLQSLTDYIETYYSFIFPK